MKNRQHRTCTYCSDYHTQNSPCKFPGHCLCSTTFFLWCQHSHSCPAPPAPRQDRSCHRTGRHSHPRWWGLGLSSPGCSWIGSPGCRQGWSGQSSSCCWFGRWGRNDEHCSDWAAFKQVIWNFESFGTVSFFILVVSYFCNLPFKQTIAIILEGVLLYTSNHVVGNPKIKAIKAYYIIGCNSVNHI